MPLGAAVEVLTGRVQASTCLIQSKRPSTRRQIRQQRDLLLGSFDDNANSLEQAPKGKTMIRISFIFFIIIIIITLYVNFQQGLVCRIRIIDKVRHKEIIIKFFPFLFFSLYVESS